MADEGATVFRLNAGQFKDQQDGTYYVECEDTSKPVDEVIHSIRRLETDLRRPLLTYLDLAGPKLRVEEVREAMIIQSSAICSCLSRSRAARQESCL